MRIGPIHAVGVLAAHDAEAAFTLPVCHDGDDSDALTCGHAVFIVLSVERRDSVNNLHILAQGTRLQGDDLDARVPENLAKPVVMRFTDLATCRPSEADDIHKVRVLHE